MDDDEYVAALLAADLPDRGPRLADWPPEVDQLAHLNDLVQQLLRATIAAAGGKGGRFRPTPRPQTAMERVRARQQRAEYDYLMALWESLPDNDGA